jgi:Sulphur globule protein
MDNDLLNSSGGVHIRGRLQHPCHRGLLSALHIKPPDEEINMKKLTKTLCVAAVAGALAIPFTAAQAWWGGGPWGGGPGGWGDGWGNDGWGDGWGDGYGDMDFSMSAGGHGSGYGRGRGYGRGYGYGYGGYPYGGWGGPYGGYGGPYGYGGYPGAYGAPYGYAPPTAAPAQPATPETSQ